MALIGTLLSLSISSTSDNTVTLSLILANGVTVTEYIISYSNTDCPNDIYDDITGISDSETMYTLTDLEEGTEYSITVTAILSDDGGTASDTVTAIYHNVCWLVYFIEFHISSISSIINLSHTQLHLLLPLL